MVNDFSSYSDAPTSPARNQRIVTPNDDADLPDGVCKALEVIVAGDVVNVAENDTVEQAVTRPNVTAGTVIFVRTRRVLSGTTATVVALY